MNQRPTSQLAVLLIPLCLACGAAPQPKPAVMATPKVVEPAFHESELLARVAAADPRVAVKPDADEVRRITKDALGVEQGEEMPGVLGGRIDVFSLSSRGQSLLRTERWFDARVAQAGPAARGSQGASVADARAWLMEVRARYEYERPIALRAASLLYAHYTHLLESGAAPTEADGLLAQRFDLLEDLIAKESRFDALDASAMEHALRDFEVRFATTPFPAAHTALTSLKLALGAASERPARGDREADTSRAFSVFSGVVRGHPHEEAMVALRETLRTASRAREAAERVAKSDAISGAASPAEVSAQWISNTHAPCSAEREALLRPPRERAYLCGLVERIARGDLGAAVLLASSDALALALWAETLVADRAAYRSGPARWPLWSSLGPDEQTRLLFRVAADPLPFMITGATLRWIFRSGIDGAAGYAATYVAQRYPRVSLPAVPGSK